MTFLKYKYSSLIVLVLLSLLISSCRQIDVFTDQNGDILSSYEKIKFCYITTHKERDADNTLVEKKRIIPKKLGGEVYVLKSWLYYPNGKKMAYQKIKVDIRGAYSQETVLKTKRWSAE